MEGDYDHVWSVDVVIPRDNKSHGSELSLYWLPSVMLSLEHWACDMYSLVLNTADVRKWILNRWREIQRSSEVTSGHLIAKASHSQAQLHTVSWQQGQRWRQYLLTAMVVIVVVSIIIDGLMRIRCMLCDGYREYVFWLCGRVEKWRGREHGAAI